MIRAGLTGGIGSGKSTVARMLAEHGAIVIDADRIAREIVEPGQPALAEIADRFGPDVIEKSGALDRAGLAAIVFHDTTALADLNAITHPRVAERTEELISNAPEDSIVVYDMPLLVENDLAEGWDTVIVVIADRQVRIARLRERGLEDDDIEARMARQASDEERRAVADIVIENSGSLGDLESQIDMVWSSLAALP